jgi:hypothetical protein
MNSSKTEPGKTEPGKTEPGKTEPGKTEPGKTEPGWTDLTRRTLLKSARPIAGASVLAAATAPARASNMSTQSTPPSGTQATTPAMDKRMVGFMLAHEQFPVTELVELGVAAEQAGFDLLATSDHLATMAG